MSRSCSSFRLKLVVYISLVWAKEVDRRIGKSVTKDALLQVNIFDFLLPVFEQSEVETRLSYRRSKVRVQFHLEKLFSQPNCTLDGSF